MPRRPDQPGVLNIIYNAIQAIAGRGVLRIVTERAGDAAVVRIADNGPGILPGVIGKIVAPFFTTKKVGEGTGLGLSISYGSGVPSGATTRCSPPTAARPASMCCAASGSTWSSISDQRMPDIGGDAVLKFALEHQPDAVRILLTGYADMESLVRCVNEAAIYKYISKPWEPENLRLTVLRALESLSLERRLKRTSEQLQSAYLDAVGMLSVACEGKDEDTGSHVQRVQFYTKALALELGLPADEAQHMGVMSILHDIGKLYIPDQILKKPAKLDAAEWEVMRRHPEFGLRILGGNPFYALAREIALCHHENVDGSGYPAGLRGDAIPLAARIVEAADVFDALTARRPYKEPWPVQRAIALLTGQSGTEFDAEVVRGFCRLHEQGKLDAIMRKYHALEQLESGAFDAPPQAPPA